MAGRGVGRGVGLTAVGGGDSTPPSVTSENYDSPTNVYSATISEGGTYYALWSTSATMTNDAIIAGATVSGSYLAGTNYSITVDDSALTVGTWYMHVCFKDAAGNKSQNATKPSRTISAPAFTEIWSSYSNGNGYTQLNANGYTRSSASFVPSLNTDANAPTGSSVSMRFGVSSNGLYYMTWGAVSSALAARTTERVNVLLKLRFQPVSTFERYAIGDVSASSNTSHTGVVFNRTAVNGNVMSLQCLGDVQGLTNITQIAASLSDSTVYWLRYEINGTNMTARYWADGAGEPGTWGTTRAVGSTVAFTRFDYVGRNGNGVVDVLGVSLGVGTDAAGF